MTTTAATASDIIDYSDTDAETCEHTATFNQRVAAGEPARCAACGEVA